MCDASTIKCVRNLKGIEYEKSGNIEKAIEMYELNVKDNFDGNHPYDRLAILYHKQKKYDDEKRVLEHAIYVFENIVHYSRADRIPKLEKFKARLEKLNNKLTK